MVGIILQMVTVDLAEIVGMKMCFLSAISNTKNEIEVIAIKFQVG